jgi:Protein of unknown function (DUF3102)
MSGLITLPTLAARIRREHEQVATSMTSVINHAIAAGELLLEAKRQVKHGEWLPWLAKNCDIAERTAQVYMRLARTPLEKRNAVADLPLRDALASLASPSAPAPDEDGDALIEADKKELIAAVLRHDGRMRELSAQCIEMCKKHNLTDAEFAASWISRDESAWINRDESWVRRLKKGTLPEFYPRLRKRVFGKTPPDPAVQGEITATDPAINEYFKRAG